MKKNYLKIYNPLIRNTIILIICSLLVKGLGLFNRIVLTRLLGNEGISLYTICLPSIMLFMTISGFSLNIALAKIVSENLVTKKYSNKKIIISSFMIGLITSFIAIIILLLIIKPLTNDWLKQKDTFYPILSIVFFLPFVLGNNILRGYYNGINKINISAYANVIEQVSRIIFSTIILIILSKYRVVLSVTMAIISMGVGEIISFFYTLIKLKKNIYHIKGKASPTKEIISLSAPTTINRLITNFTFFLEPIIYTYALTLINFNESEIMYKYSEINAYAIPLITMFSFVSTSIATSIIPKITQNYAIKDYEKMNYLIKKALLFSLLPGIIISCILFNYSDKYMNLIYGTNIGSNYVKYFIFPFLLFYLEPPVISILQSIGKSKQLLTFSIFTNILKLSLIFLLTLIPKISYNSLIITMVINSLIVTLTLIFYLKNIVNLKFNMTNIINIIILFALTFFTILFLKNIKIHYLLASFISGILFLIYMKLLKFINF